MAYRRSALMEERLAGNRERILHAARALIAEGGYRNAPVTAVAAAAGVSTGQIYRHFPSKADLFVEVLNAAVQHEMGILRAISAEPVSAAERLRKAIAAFVRRALAGPALAYAFIAEPVEGEVDAERIRGRRLFGEVFRQLLAEGVAAGEFPEQSLDAAAACIVGAFTEALVGPVAHSRHDPQQGEQLVEAICGFCLRAVGARGSG
ncbi:TetR/AcrR family transcriptional regulator [Xanthomonas campestris]|uniref:TetR/AcrR family transcriptional regulator n=1 Tax=Xanthomonas campestris TaxID=339 RepID=UPI002378F066|nr:TetR/AcrR family transcriptional regulator [Xanthomonas campestris]WDL18058.1 TetR/AcrR family transcriptional regulator [Xanthomonas campestris pv. campestris]WDL22142.1 TetR/AcrR family transcriptional regulator [Xanthomonas campestris pv. campestris]WDL25782.1 TetR/AcrR family transcriptional regulator [Xanthomonas campestris pv. campestris]WDL30314.1 TetR/AcrR family transcriptional regulator [Xanthomonas campestris pv. campestris]WDL33959.1 TetR/AcrR family transcriptional regulator [X